MRSWSTENGDVAWKAILAVFLLSISISLAAAPSLPVDLLQPEGKTRWDLTSASSKTVPSFSIEQPGEPPLLLHNGEAREFETLDRGVTIRVRVEGRGAGWLHLPSGPREVVLQRIQIWQYSREAKQWLGSRWGYRFVESANGTLATVIWAGAEIGSGEFVGGGLGPQQPDAPPDVKIYVNDSFAPPLSSVSYSWNRGAVPVSSLDPAGYANAGALIGASSWNFSGNTSGSEMGSTTTSVTASETCNAARCGYSGGTGKHLDRQDTNFDNSSTLNKNNQVSERQDRAGDVVIWLRAGAQHEGKTGALGSGESRYCYQTDGTGTRSEVPLYIFSHSDANGFYMGAGDSWSSPAFNCEQNIFNQTCGQANLFDKLYTKACGTHSGKQFGSAIKTGVVTVPSGHTFNTLLVKTVADFCIYSVAGCSFLVKVDEARTTNYSWLAPHIGTVARIQSPQNPSDETGWTTTDETEFKFGLLPPRTISSTGQTNTTISLSWDPGLDTHRIKNYKIYWDTDSGGSTPYAFNSDSNSGQVSFSGTTATISGLNPGTTYYFTVTARSDFKDPSTNVTTTYESILYPTQVFGDPDKVYPIEVVISTTGGGCTPTQQVNGLNVSKVVGGNLQFCWTASADACVTGYRVLGSNNATNDTAWSTVGDVASPNTCLTASASQTFYLVVGKGGNGQTGPWGHYGH